MEGLSSLCGYSEESIDELKNKHLYRTLELQKMKMKMKVEVREHQDTVQHLLNLLATAYKERNEARDHLQKVINKLTSSSSPGCRTLSCCLSPVDSFSSDLPNWTMAGSSNMGFANRPFVQERHSGYELTGSVSSGVLNSGKDDRGSAVIDYLTKGRLLPQKGKFLQAVMDSGPLLQSLLITGSLPRWQNPPPLHRFVGIFPDSSHQKQVANPISAICGASNSSSIDIMNHGSPPAILQFRSNSTGAPSVSGLSNAQISISSTSSNSQNTLCKRQLPM